MARLVGVGSRPVDEFVVWILSNVPRFEQAAFRTLGLHDAVLRLFDSPSDEARAYAAEYARTHARDLPVDELVRLANNNHEAVRKLAADLLQAPRPAQGGRPGRVGPAAGDAARARAGRRRPPQALRRRELTPEWFRARLFAENAAAFEFVQGAAAAGPPRREAGAGLLRRPDRRDRRDASDVRRSRVAEFALDELARFDLNALDRDFLRRLVLRPTTRDSACDWIDEGRLKAQRSSGSTSSRRWPSTPTGRPTPGWPTFGASGRAWAKELAFDEALADRCSAGSRRPAVLARRPRLRLADAAGRPGPSRATTTSPSRR